MACVQLDKWKNEVFVCFALLLLSIESKKIKEPQYQPSVRCYYMLCLRLINSHVLIWNYYFFHLQFFVFEKIMLCLGFITLLFVCVNRMIIWSAVSLSCWLSVFFSQASNCWTFYERFLNLISLLSFCYGKNLILANKWKKCVTVIHHYDCLALSSVKLKPKLWISFHLWYVFWPRVRITHLNAFQPMESNLLMDDRNSVLW